MCFNQPMSSLFAALLWIVPLVWRKLPWSLRLTSMYFAIMETIQAAQYSFIDDCDNIYNIVLTYAGLVHLAFQPVFANLYMFEFGNKAQRRYRNMVLSMCLFAGVLLTNRMWMTGIDALCTPHDEILCGTKACTFSGKVHLGWSLPVTHSDNDYFTPGWSLHFFLFNAPVIAIGMWKWSAFSLITGPIMARMFTNTDGELAAIWCFFSIFQVFIPVVYYKFRYGTVEAREKEEAASDKPEDVDSVGSWWKIALRVFWFTAFLQLKRYASFYVNSAIPV